MFGFGGKKSQKGSGDGDAKRPSSEEVGRKSVWSRRSEESARRVTLTPQLLQVGERETIQTHTFTKPLSPFVSTSGLSRPDAFSDATVTHSNQFAPEASGWRREDHKSRESGADSEKTVIRYAPRTSSEEMTVAGSPTPTRAKLTVQALRDPLKDELQRELVYTQRQTEPPPNQPKTLISRPPAYKLLDNGTGAQPCPSHAQTARRRAVRFEPLPKPKWRIAEGRRHGARKAKETGLAEYIKQRDFRSESKRIRDRQTVDQPRMEWEERERAVRRSEERLRRSEEKVKRERRRLSMLCEVRRVSNVGFSGSSISALVIEYT